MSSSSQGEGARSRISWPSTTRGLPGPSLPRDVPVVSAVGHEIDFTIADFVADMRAPTPSAAAELVVPMRSDLTQQIRALDARLVSAGERLLKSRKDRLETLAERVRDPRRRLVDLRLGLDERFNSLTASLVRRVRTGA